MFFSLITPTPGAERVAAIQWTKGPYAQHQWLWQFLSAEPGTPRDFIFRRRDGENKLPGFYVVSKRLPKTISESWEVSHREYDPQISVGQRLAFEIRANPVISHKVGGKSRRDDVVMHEKRRLLKDRGFQSWADWYDDEQTKPLLYDLVQSTCTKWFESRSERAGFRLVKDSQNSQIVRVDGYVQQRAEKKDIRFSSVDFSGELEVTDKNAFLRTLFEGLGHAKAFGCGLMMVKRA